MLLLVMVAKLLLAVGLVPGVLAQIHIIELTRVYGDGMGFRTPWFVYPGVAANAVASVALLVWACADVDLIVAALNRGTL